MMENFFEEDLTIETVVLGGGCFWCTEAIFKMFKGIISVVPGYAGGYKEFPIYEEVMAHKTGHAEVVKIEYNPYIISFNQILTIFFSSHDPTSVNRQGLDVGEQYRSVIFYTTFEQKRLARMFITLLNRSTKMGRPIVTQVLALENFYPAETYHRDYYKKHPQQPYCQIVINPKLKKVQEKFSNLLKTHQIW